MGILCMGMTFSVDAAQDYTVNTEIVEIDESVELTKTETMNIIIDNGHGGMIDNVYQTPGKRSPIWSDGKQLFEGVFNRNVANKLSSKLGCNDIDTVILVPEQLDVSLKDRAERVNDIYKDRKDSILLSIHANAGGGTGFEMFTSIGETKSDKIADTLIQAYAKEMPELRLRKGKEFLNKQKDFYILRKTHCPAVLIECAFMDTRTPDFDLLMEEDRIVKALFKGVVALT